MQDNNFKTGINRRQFICISASSLIVPGSVVFSSTTLTKIRQDWHIHTHKNGGKPNAIIGDIIKTNQEYGLDLMGISEHIDRVDQRTWFEGVCRENTKEAMNVPTKMKVIVGTESTMINPKLCAVGKEIADELDYVMVACNHYHLKHVENPNPATPQAYADHYLDMLMGAVELGYADTIAHPFFHTKLGKIFSQEDILKITTMYNEDRLVQVLKRAAEANMAFEINPRHADLALYFFMELVQEARRHGTKFTLGTDAHALESLGYPEGNSGRTCIDILNDLTITEKDLKWEPKNGFSKI